jgi:hypothetical protein
MENRNINEQNRRNFSKWNITNKLFSLLTTKIFYAKA